MSILFDVPRNVIYASLNKCRSTLKILDWKAAHKGQLTFLHASFADYLKDSSRSGNFYVGSVGDVEEDVALSSLGVWIKCTGDDIATSMYRFFALKNRCHNCFNVSEVYVAS